MGMVLNTNIGAIQAQRALTESRKDMEKAMERLSTGKRINGAADDAAGLAMVERMNTQIRGLTMATRNANDGISLIRTVENALVEVSGMLQRMRVLAVQSANDTNNGQDRTNLQAEMDAMITEIDRIAGTTTWAGEQLMDEATGTTFSFQVGSATGTKNQIVVTLESMNATKLGVMKTAIDLETNMTSRLASIHEVDHAIEKVNNQRSELGAVSNRLNHTVNNLTNISSNLSAAKGGIEDADFALETTNLAKNQILQQASTAMLAQANASKQNVLSLLQG